MNEKAFFPRLSEEGKKHPVTRGLEHWYGEALSAGRKRIAGWLADLGDRVATIEVDLQPFFQAWIHARDAPAKTAANGLG